jgi:hypothetical protein
LELYFIIGDGDGELCSQKLTSMYAVPILSAENMKKSLLGLNSKESRLRNILMIMYSPSKARDKFLLEQPAKESKLRNMIIIMVKMDIAEMESFSGRLQWK